MCYVIPVKQLMVYHALTEVTAQVVISCYFEFIKLYASQLLTQTRPQIYQRQFNRLVVSRTYYSTLDRESAFKFGSLKIHP